MHSFVEDRLATLKNVIKEPELDGWNLYLGNFSLTSYFLKITCTLSSSTFLSLFIQWGCLVGAVKWGYNTQKEREEAAGISRVQLLEISDFSQKLK